MEELMTFVQTYNSHMIYLFSHGCSHERKRKSLLWQKQDVYIYHKKKASFIICIPE